MAGIEQNNGASKQIRSLLFVLLLGVMSAGALAGFFLYSYGPTGIYQLKNIMISPDVLGTLTYPDHNPGSNKSSRYALDKIMFSYWESSSRQWKKTAVSLDAYQSFYHRFANATSLPVASEDVISSFQRQPPATLTLDVSASIEGNKMMSKKFQGVDFASGGDFFRVELHEQAAGSNWAYFFSPGIYREALSIFASKEETK